MTIASMARVGTFTEHKFMCASAMTFATVWVESDEWNMLMMRVLTSEALTPDECDLLFDEYFLHAHDTSRIWHHPVCHNPGCC